MASFRKRGNKWECQIRRKGHPSITKSFTNKSDAQAWSRRIEIDLENGTLLNTLKASEITLHQLMARYQEMIAPTKKNPDWTEGLANNITHKLGKLSIVELTPSVIATYRDSRLINRSPQTVKHEVCFIGRVLTVASREWGLTLPAGNPVNLVSKPKLPRGRERRLGNEEKKTLLSELTSSPAVRSIVQLALETAMRRSEILRIEKSHINYKNRTLFIPLTKTDTPRTIPLSVTATRILRHSECPDRNRLFTMQPRSVSQAFRRACERARIDNLRFHDLRHEATTRLFEKGLNPMEVASITGHQDLKMLKRYTHLRAVDLAAKLQ